MADATTPKLSVLRKGEQRRNATGILPIEGENYGAAVSLFLVDIAPGSGPGRHRHPYAETWIVRGGRARIVVDGRETVAEPGDIVVIEPGETHEFKSIGDERLDIVCIHPSPRFVTEWLE
jgi:quercetin dioxygenase-like cupin family protein